MSAQTSPAESVHRTLHVLHGVLDRYPAVTIAASGGVDSMTLAFLAHRHAGARVTVAHAVSPAVPAEATERVKRHAARHGWNLRLLDAGEMADENYLSNPVDRCLYCKRNLYGELARVGVGVIASGTNVDDLADYRPGLRAADQYGVVHPWVLAGVGKAGIYELASAHGLDDLAALPAQPCLSSRIETGIRVSERDLRFIERVEIAMREHLPASAALRCRITAAGVVLESDPMPSADTQAGLLRWAEQACRAEGRVLVGWRPYRRGAAFLRVEVARSQEGGMPAASGSGAPKAHEQA